MTRRQDRTNLRTFPLQIAGYQNGEEWRAIVNYPGYFVSNLGRVCSIDRVVARSNRGPQLCRGKILRPGPSISGHLTVSLTRYNSKSVHVLVLIAFRGPCPEGCEGLHGDDNPANNTLTNLRWGTRSENLHDAVRNGKKRIGEQITHSKLTDDAVRFIRANPTLSLTSLGNRFGVHAQAIKQVRQRTTWRHVA